MDPAQCLVYAQPMPADGATSKKLKLYVLPGSHPCAAVEVALHMKSVPFSRVDLLPMVQMAVGPLLYGGMTVPGVRMDGEKIVGSRKIMRRLDEIAPDPPLLPADAAARAEVLEVERWGDETFQSVPRRLLDAGFLRNAGCMESYLGPDVKLPLPRGVLRPALPATARLMAIRNKAKDEHVRADLGALPDQLAKIDAWIEEGLLGGRAAECRRPADRLDDPAAADDRRRAPVAGEPPGRRADALLPADGGRNPSRNPAGGAAGGKFVRLTASCAVVGAIRPKEWT